MHMERCAYAKCNRPHDTRRGQAVRIDGKYYCRPSHANAARGVPSYRPKKPEQTATKRTP